MISSLLVAACLAPVPSLSIKVDGDGYLRFIRGSNVLYSRSAVLVPSAKGLVTADGSILAPQVFVPAGGHSLTCSLDGEISVNLIGKPQVIGRIVLAVFKDSPTFGQVGPLLSTSSKPNLANPGDGTTGVIRLERVASKGAAQVLVKPKTSGTAGHGFAAPVAEVTVRAESQIEGETITLDSIADINGDPSLVKTLKGIDLGRAPYFGTARGLTLATVRAQIAAAQVDIRNIQISVPSGAKVLRKSQSVSIETINQTVAEAFRKKYGQEVGLDLKTRQLAVPVPVGEATVEASNLQIRESDLTVTVDISVNKKLSSTLNLTYSAAGLTQVRYGDDVKLKMISAAATVVVKGKAQGTAYLGQKVTVKTETGAMQTGILMANNTVEVRL